MTIRTILAPLSGGAATQGAIDTAFGLARRFGAHVEAVHVRPDERQTLMLYSDGFGAPIEGELLDRIAEETVADAAAARRAFDAAVDLVVLGRSDRVVDRPHSDTVEDTVLRSGRPVLLAPAKPSPDLGRSIAVGWNGSAEGVRAMAAALPLREHLHFLGRIVSRRCPFERPGIAEHDFN